MRFASFADPSGNPIKVNPANVLQIAQYDGKGTYIYYSKDHRVYIPLPIDVVAEDLERAASS